MLTLSASRSSSIDQSPTSEIRQWLEDFATAVRARNFAAGRALFADNVFASGSRADRVDELEDLEFTQWRPIWNSNRGYRFYHDAAIIDVSGAVAWVAIMWRSQGNDALRGWYDRFGRATYILRKVEGRWVAFSRVRTADSFLGTCDSRSAMRTLQNAELFAHQSRVGQTSAPDARPKFPPISR